MKTKQIKVLAATTVITFGMTLFSAPAFAVSTNIVSETEGKTTLTMSQVQDLAVIYNPTKQDLLLNFKKLDNEEATTANQKYTIENQLNASASSGAAAVSELQAEMAKRAAELEAEGKDPQSDVQYQMLAMQMQQLLASSGSSSSFDSAISNIKTIDTALDQIKYSKDDLNKATSDLETQVRYMAGQLSTALAQLDKSIAVAEQGIALTKKSVEIAELQQQLGMNISIDVISAKTGLVNSEKELVDLKETRDAIKRQINTLIGRNTGSPLEVVPMNLPVAVNSAPAYTETLLKKIIDNNYTLKTLERDIQLEKDSMDGVTDSDTLKKSDYKVEEKKTTISNTKDAIAEKLKTLLTKINVDGEAYKVARDKYGVSQKAYEYAQLKYNQGVISQLDLQKAELEMKQAELTNMKAGYQFYFDWQEYYAMEKGIDVSGK